jgi:hypothetical protein
MKSELDSAKHLAEQQKNLQQKLMDLLYEFELEVDHQKK